MKNKAILAVLALSLFLAAIPSPAQTPAYHALLLGISDGRTNIQVEHPKGMNQWGQVVGYYGGGQSGGGPRRPVDAKFRQRRLQHRNVVLA